MMGVGDKVYTAAAKAKAKPKDGTVVMVMIWMVRRQ